ncbi:hypothetical protein B0H13DRAFT_2366912 [Mycena leptocephala]|nr:hypothetical protein B0H13DRAFT_2366912 [Mycena leptocephala]
MDVSDMEVVGTSAADGDRVLRYEVRAGQQGIRRPDTPNLPCKLLEKQPTLVVTGENSSLSPLPEIPLFPLPDLPSLPQLWDRKTSQPEWEKPSGNAINAPLERLRHSDPRFLKSLSSSAPAKGFEERIHGEKTSGRDNEGNEDGDENKEEAKAAQPSIRQINPSSEDPERSELPVYGSGKRGPIVTRDRFSSSPSLATSDSSDDSSDVYSPTPPFRITAPAFVSSRDPRPPPRQILWKSQERSEHKGSVGSSSIGSPPPLVPASCSESEAVKFGNGHEIEVETRDVHQILSSLRHRPPTPFTDDNCKDGQEDGAVLRPLWDALHIMDDLENILDNEVASLMSEHSQGLAGFTHTAPPLAGRKKMGFLGLGDLSAAVFLSSSTKCSSPPRPSRSPITLLAVPAHPLSHHAPRCSRPLRSSLPPATSPPLAALIAAGRHVWHTLSDDSLEASSSLAVNSDGATS